MNRFARLLSPLASGGMQLRQRPVMSGITTHYSPPGLAFRQRLNRYTPAPAAVRGRRQRSRGAGPKAAGKLGQVGGRGGAQGSGSGLAGWGLGGGARGAGG